MTLVAKNTDFYYDARSLDGLRAKSRNNESHALREVAKKFESIFMKMMIKSMRQASEGDPFFNSEGQKFYTQMYDDQLSIELTKGNGMGLADMMVKQMEGPTLQTLHNRIAPRVNTIKTVDELKAEQAKSFEIPKREKAVKAYELVSHLKPNQPEAKSAEIRDVKPAPVGRELKAGSPNEFIRSVWPHAQKAAAKLKVKPEVLVAQAALETGWGKHVIKTGKGESSNNLFNIKADRRWDGDSIGMRTLEFVKGNQVSEKSQFRSYESVTESFNDYVNFLQSSDRYQKALEHGSDPVRFVKELQAAGYATDPRYADKITNIMGRESVKNTIQQLRDSEAQSLVGRTG